MDEQTPLSDDPARYVRPQPALGGVTAGRRARERRQVRERILDAARALFAAEGYDAVTMRRLAERIAYTPPVIYRHFADKAALMRELCVRDFRALARAFSALAGVADPLERLRRLGARYVAFALTHPNHYRLMFMTPPPIVVALGPAGGRATTHRCSSHSYAVLDAAPRPLACLTGSRNPVN